MNTLPHSAAPWDTRSAFPFLGWFSCVLCAIVTLALPERALARQSPALLIWVTFSLLLLIAVAGFFEAKQQGHNPWVAPVSLITAYYFFRYGWGSVVAYYWDQFPFEAVPGLKSRFWGVRDNIATACPLMLLCGVGLYLGLSCMGPRLFSSLPVLKWPINEIKFRRNVVLYSPIALLIFGVLQFLLPIELRFAVLTLGSISGVLTVIAAYWCFSAPTHSARVKWGIFVTALVVCSAVFGFVTGMVGDFVHPLVNVLLGYVLARRTYPWKFLAVSIPLAFVAVFPWLTIYKYYGHPAGLDLTVPERVERTRSVMSWLGYRAGLELALERSVARLSGSTFPAVFVQYYPSVYPFVKGQTFLLEASTLIPRVIWPEKPQLSAELNRYSMAVGIVREREGTSAVFDAASEYYLNFGVLGVLILSIIHGSYLAILYRWLAGSHYIMGASIFLILFFENTDFFGVGQLFVAHVKVIPVWLLLLYWMSSASKASRLVPRPNAHGIRDRELLRTV